MHNQSPLNEHAFRLESIKAVIARIKKAMEIEPEGSTDRQQLEKALKYWEDLPAKGSVGGKEEMW